jgi:putative glutathione S-transferase
LGQEAQDNRQQRVTGNYPNAQFGVRRLYQCAHRLLPEPLRAQIDRLNDLIYPNINNGAIVPALPLAGCYEQAFAMFSIRSMRLSKSRRSTAIWLAAPLLSRLAAVLYVDPIDAVYYSHFKCNWRHIYEFPNLSNYLRDLYQVPGVAETVSIEQIKRHYYGSQRQVNPTGIVPVGPQLEFAVPHDRARFR